MRLRLVSSTRVEATIIQPPNYRRKHLPYSSKYIHFEASRPKLTWCISRGSLFSARYYARDGVNRLVSSRSLINPAANTPALANEAEGTIQPSLPVLVKSSSLLTKDFLPIGNALVAFLNGIRDRGTAIGSFASVIRPAERQIVHPPIATPATNGHSSDD